LQLLMGELVLATGGQRSDAESNFSAALEVARRQAAPLFEQRAAEGLERLRAVAG
jgi:hypothetical protein